MQVPEQLRQVAEEVERTGQPVRRKARTLLGWFGHQRRGEIVDQKIREALKATGLRTEPEFDDRDTVVLDDFLSLTADAHRPKAQLGSDASDSSVEKPPDPVEEKEIEGLGEGGSWGDYPIDDLLIRQETRTIYEVVRRINKGFYVMNPDFQRDLVWEEAQQSKLIESVIMRIPLPVFYLAEDEQGRMVVVDGLQRLSTFRKFLKDELVLRLSHQQELEGKRFSNLSPKLQNRVEDCNLIFYIIDSKVAESARLDIFERVNSGVPLTRQQMRNSLYMGRATRFLRKEAETEIFLGATGRSLKSKTMRDREFVNRFCAFRLLGVDEYRGDMDRYLATCLLRMNKMAHQDLDALGTDFRRGLTNNLLLFRRHAFRKHAPRQNSRSVLNASLWDVMSTGLSRYSEDHIRRDSAALLKAFYGLLASEEFNTAITYATNDQKRVRARFEMTEAMFREVLGAHTA
ncbi:MAG: DUF262 domain-containing protein [Gammaproteobacteria bacterium]|nr:DUF262 domain-containing protein [Gammaproteobacteria bacterium]